MSAADWIVQPAKKKKCNLSGATDRTPADYLVEFYSAAAPLEAAK
jgi:hypothetical protein